MYNEQIEALISAALADGALTEKEKQILFKKAQSMGIDLDEFEMVLDARLVQLKKEEKEKAEKSAPKSTKYGDVRKCPVCGALVPALAGLCPDCGYEFSGIDAISSSKELANLLIKSSDINQQCRIIESFPIPLTKTDLLEFITSLKYKSLDINDALSVSYYKKLAECIEKVKAVFISDPQLSPYIQEFEKITIVRTKEIKKKNFINFVLWFLQPIQLCVLLILLAILFEYIFIEDSLLFGCAIFYTVLFAIPVIVGICKKGFFRWNKLSK